MDVITAAEAFDFMEFRLDRSGGGLFRADGSSVPIGSRALDILQLLVEASGELVSKDRIRDVVWQGLAVEESNLTVQISALPTGKTNSAGTLVSL